MEIEKRIREETHKERSERPAPTRANNRLLPSPICTDKFNPTSRIPHYGESDAIRRYKESASLDLNNRKATQRRGKSEQFHCSLFGGVSIVLHEYHSKT